MLYNIKTDLFPNKSESILAFWQDIYTMRNPFA